MIKIDFCVITIEVFEWIKSSAPIQIFMLIMLLAGHEFITSLADFLPQLIICNMPTPSSNIYISQFVLTLTIHTSMFLVVI